MRVPLAVAVLLMLSSGCLAQSDPESPWYLERGPAPAPEAEDSVQQTALDLAALLRDGGVPGFYDGQFASTRDRFDELAAIASDLDMDHVLRVMAVMALQEAGSGEDVARVLEPLVISPDIEFNIEHNAFNNMLMVDDDETIRSELRAALSQHARFALAKDGQPAKVLEKIERMEQHIVRSMPKLLDPSFDSFSVTVSFGRQVIFDIAYHYQQFDDYAHAEEWFHRLTDNLVGLRETRWAHYNLACIAALTGRSEEAVEELRKAHAVGFTDVAWMEEDGDLASIRDLPAYKALVAEIRNQPPPTPVPPTESVP
jgi:hypothetical protein